MTFKQLINVKHYNTFIISFLYIYTNINLLSWLWLFRIFGKIRWIYIQHIKLMNFI